MNTKTVFRFEYFRFVIAAILLLAAGLKAYQLATSPLPPVVQGSIFTTILELLNSRWLLMVVVVVEILFALFLMSGLWRKWTWLASILCFSAFALVSMAKALSGESTCGCLGNATINPWITTIFDVFIVGFLFIFSESGRFSIDWKSKERQKLVTVLFVWIALATPALLAMFSAQKNEIAKLGTEFVGVDGKATIMLEPEKWIGKEFPLWDHVDEKSKPLLKQGEWTIIIVRKQCEECRQLIEKAETQSPTALAILELANGSVDTGTP